MANYAIMRCKKLTGMGSVASALQHCYRERETPNANAERTPENYCSVSKSTDQAMNIVFERAGTARRKNGLGSGIAASLSVRGSGISTPRT
ncbi:plasmid recombination protein [Escherichia coli]|uniref:plasmid recombination protein n=1 Tax=Escherichia coli TaxID=562 RepID=UPI001FCF22AA|nr:plasmid recombination protein [Escherichia coli]